MKKFKVSIFLIAILFSIISQANQSHVKDALGVESLIQFESTHQSQKTRQYVLELFQWINRVGTRHKSLTISDMQHYYARNVRYIVNGVSMANDRKKLYKHFRSLLKALKVIRVVKPYKEIIVSGDQAAIIYRLATVNNKGSGYIDKVAALITFSNGKVSFWRELSAHTGGQGNREIKG